MLLQANGWWAIKSGTSALGCILGVSLWVALHCIALGCSIFSARLIWWQVRPHMGERALALPQCLRHLHSAPHCSCYCSTLLCSPLLHMLLHTAMLMLLHTAAYAAPLCFPLWLYFALLWCILLRDQLHCQWAIWFAHFSATRFAATVYYSDLQIQVWKTDLISINHTELPCIDMFACFRFCNLQLRRAYCAESFEILLGSVLCLIAHCCFSNDTACVLTTLCCAGWDVCVVRCSVHWKATTCVRCSSSECFLLYIQMQPRVCCPLSECFVLYT